MTNPVTGGKRRNWRSKQAEAHRHRDDERLRTLIETAPTTLDFSCVRLDSTDRISLARDVLDTSLPTCVRLRISSCSMAITGTAGVFRHIASMARGDSGGGKDGSCAVAGLVSIDASSNRTGDAGAEEISAAVREINLARARRQNSNLNTIRDLSVAKRAFSSLRPGRSPGLTTLRLSGNEITSDGAQCLAGSLPPYLRELDLSQNLVGNTGVVALAASLPATVTLLDLSGNSIGDEGAIALADCFLGSQDRGTTPHGIKRLSLHYNRIGQSGARTIARVLPMLQSFGISGNKIYDAGVDIARGVASATDLTTIEMAHCQVGDDTAIQLAVSIASGGAPALRSVVLSFNMGVTDIGAEALATATVARWRLLGTRGSKDKSPPATIVVSAGPTTDGTLPEGTLPDGVPTTLQLPGRAKSSPPMLDLILVGDEIGDAGAQAFARGMSGHPLTFGTVDLSCNTITASGLDAVSAAVRETRDLYFPVGLTAAQIVSFAWVCRHKRQRLPKDVLRRIAAVPVAQGKREGYISPIGVCVRVVTPQRLRGVERETLTITT